MPLKPQTAFMIATTLAAIGFSEAPALARSCKAPVTVTSRSTIKSGEDARTQRATDNAKKRWSKIVRQQDGIAYYFWIRSTDQKIECRQTPKSSICTATATPCTPF